MTEEKDKSQTMVSRPPIVVVLGHVDSGKCVAPETMIPLSDGEILSIEEIWKKFALKSSKRYVKDSAKEGFVYTPVQKLEVFSFDGAKTKKREISHIWQLKAPQTLIRMVLNSGDEVAVTPEHPFFILSPNGKFNLKRADQLDKRDFILVPQKLNFRISASEIKKRIAERLGKIENFVVFLDNNKAKDFLNSFRQVNKQQLFQEGVFSTNPFDALREKRFRARDFIKIGTRLGFSFEELYEMIGYVKNASEKWRAGHTSNKIKLPSIPKNLEKLGYVIGCLVGDGQTEGGMLHNSNLEIQKVFQQYLRKVFEATTKITKTRTTFKIENSGYKTFTRFLTDILDFPRYHKSGKIGFPSVFLGSEPFTKGFIAGWFDTDGYIPFSGNKHDIEITSKSEKLVRTVSILLLHFGIHSVVYSRRKNFPKLGKKRTYFYLKIGNSPYLSKFFKTFPIRHKLKKQRIEESIKDTSTSRIFDLTPIAGSSLKSFYINEHKFPYFSKYREYRNLSRRFLRGLLKWKNKISLPRIFLEPSLKHLVNPGEISCLQIKEKRIIKNRYKYVYDLTVPGLHNFVAERVFVHNTSLLDAIRKTHVADKESGGITQHVGAYEVELQGKKITFIDTPGHEAFSAMRSRGAKVADIAVLVIDSVSGIQPQTKEAINHIKKAGISLIVAFNKVDLPTANPERIKNDLMKEGIQVESFGGKIPSIEVSGKTGKGIDALLEMILLIAEMEGFKADLNKVAEGVVIEAYLDNLRGPIATLLLREGRLQIGEIIGTPTTFGKIKGMEDFKHLSLTEALPSMPVVVMGLEDVPHVGDKVKAFPNPDEAKLYVQKKERKAGESPVIMIEEGKKVLNLILKADVSGSLEAIEEVLASLPQEKIILRILDKQVGEVNENDIKLAEASKAVILTFRVKLDSTALVLKERSRIRVLSFDIIYTLAQAVRQLMENALEPEIFRKTIGKLKVLVIFKTDKNREIIGGKVVEGEIKKGSKLEVWRQEESLGKGRLVSLQENKKDVFSVPKGGECGILFEGEIKIQEGDIVEAFEEERKKAELET